MRTKIAALIALSAAALVGTLVPAATQPHAGGSAATAAVTGTRSGGDVVQVTSDQERGSLSIGLFTNGGPDSPGA
ncbi:hypothetical protein [Streptomyces sp. NPDC049813]|uniref:hypothetical protein n=1 Tax=Streptomyces sp. NPDC049813 TaxID=3365597 RepID=UPI00378BDD2B